MFLSAIPKGVDEFPVRWLGEDAQVVNAVFVHPAAHHRKGACGIPRVQFKDQSSGFICNEIACDPVFLVVGRICPVVPTPANDLKVLHGPVHADRRSIV